MEIAARHLERCKEIALLLLKYGRVDLVNAPGMQEAIDPAQAASSVPAAASAEDNDRPALIRAPRRDRARGVRNSRNAQIGGTDPFLPTLIRCATRPPLASRFA